MENFPEKPKRRARQMPLDFVIPLQLEECMARLENRPYETYTGLRIQPDDLVTGNYQFSASLYQDERILLHTQGYVQRWEGISTRFQGTTFEPGGQPGKSLLTFFIPVFYVIVTLFCFVVGFYPSEYPSTPVPSTFSETRLPWSLLLPCCAGWILVYLAGMLALDVLRRANMARRLIKLIRIDLKIF